MPIVQISVNLRHAYFRQHGPFVETCGLPTTAGNSSSELEAAGCFLGLPLFLDPEAATSIETSSWLVTFGGLPLFLGETGGDRTVAAAGAGSVDFLGRPLGLLAGEDAREVALILSFSSSE